jgi:hypothetical protein
MYKYWTGFSLNTLQPCEIDLISVGTVGNSIFQFKKCHGICVLFFFLLWELPPKQGLMLI